MKLIQITQSFQYSDSPIDSILLSAEFLWKFCQVGWHDLREDLVWFINNVFRWHIHVTILFHIHLSSSWTWNFSRPNCSSRTQDIDLGFTWTFIYLTSFLIWKIVSLQFIFADVLVLSTWTVNWSDISGHTKSIRDLVCRPFNSIAGAWCWL